MSFHDINLMIVHISRDPEEHAAEPHVPLTFLLIRWWLCHKVKVGLAVGTVHTLNYSFHFYFLLYCDDVHASDCCHVEISLCGTLTLQKIIMYFAIIRPIKPI